MSEVPQQKSPPRTQYEAMRDNDFQHLNNQEADDIQATQALARRTTTLGDNAVAESGIIEEITCYNFMCHQRLHVELGPLINFIVGENGSGKSAVLTALTLCLGGKASDTNRGGSLKSFVKEGCDQGSLVVKLKNQGSDAYQPDLYGESIIIERHFSKTGSSGFKIKSAMDKIISTKKQEVDEISEWFALQIGNPLTVLSQDNARQFLNSASPAQKYKYFITGVQLEQLDNDYKMTQDTLDKTLVIRDDLTENIAAVKKEMEEAARLAKTVEANEGMRASITKYRHQLAWIQVQGKEKELADAVHALQDIDQRLEELEAAKQQTTAVLQNYDEKLNEAKEAQQAVEEESGTYTERRDAAQDEYDAKKAETAAIHKEEREAHSQLQKAKSELEQIEDDIRKEERRLEESSGAAQAAKNAELNEAAEQESDVNNRLKETNDRIADIKSSLPGLKERFNKAESAKKAKHQQVVEAQTHLNQIKTKTGGPLDGYGPEVVRLVKSVESESSSFSQRPVGPVGAHIRLLKPEWSTVLEKTLGQVLNAFIVRNKSDQTKLKALMKRCGIHREPPIFIAHGGHIDTSSQEPEEQFDTILKVLEFDSDTVRSQLIINNSIEKIILVPERIEAENIMMNSERPPRNVTACLTFHDGANKHGWGINLQRKPTGGANMSPIAPLKSGLPRMRSDSGEQIRLAEQTLKQFGREMVTVSSEERLAKQALAKATTEIDQNRQQLQQLRKDLRHVQARKESIQAEMDLFEGTDSRLLTLRNTFEERKKMVEKQKQTYGHLGATKNEVRQISSEKLKALNEIKAEVAEFDAKLTKAKDKVQQISNKRHIALGHKNTAFEDWDRYTIARGNAEWKKQEATETVEQWTRDAQGVAPERVTIPEGETMDSIKAKWAKLKQQLKAREERVGATDEEILGRARATRKRYTDVHQQAKDVDDTIRELKQALEHRLNLWRQFQRQISARIRIQFSYLLSERAFRGKINLDHRARQVHLHVEPDETRASGAGRNTKTLSGGEKSFSSICMLLSVWEAIGSPIRCLDEFDVFMDSVNRAISTRMLVSSCE